jgi:plastocyanin
MRLTFTIGIFISMFVAFLFHTKAQTSHGVSATNNVFTPSDLTISVGDTVVWTNNEGFHNLNGTTSAYPDNPESFGNSTGSDWVYSFVFITPGTYNYHCDPHQSLGMTGTITVEGGAAPEPFALNFSGMTPHIGQDLWLSVKESDSGEEVTREKVVVEEAFTIPVEEIVAGKSYVLDFYADHNENGMYDAPSTDHAWRIEVMNAEENGSVDFVHNTDFTDIQWEHKLTIDFASMNPHIGQSLTMYLIEQPSGIYIDTVKLDEIPGAAFSLSSSNIMSNMSYQIDFYADHNQNGSYDAPPTDHAWRITVNDLVGDSVVTFTHNTDFTDIFEETTSGRANQLTEISIYPNPATDILEITSGNENAGLQELSIYAVTGKKIETVKAQNSRKVQVDISYLQTGIYILQLKTENATETLRFIKK